MCTESLQLPLACLFPLLLGACYPPVLSGLRRNLLDAALAAAAAVICAAATTVSCSGFPSDPANGVMFCPDNGRDPGNWVQGTTCVAECLHGIAGSDQKPYAVCLSNGQWSDTVGICKPACSLPPLLCP